MRYSLVVFLLLLTVSCGNYENKLNPKSQAQPIISNELSGNLKTIPTGIVGACRTLNDRLFDSLSTEVATFIDNLPAGTTTCVKYTAGTSVMGNCCDIAPSYQCEHITIKSIRLCN